MDGLRGFLIKADKSCSRVETLSALESATAADTKLLWLDIEGELTEEAEAEFSRVLGWHPIVIENFHLSSSRPKLTNFDRYSQVTLHALNLGSPSDEARTVEIDLVIAKNYLITYHRHKVQSIEETLEDIRQARLANLGADELLYHIVAHLLDKYTPVIEEKRELISALEQEALYEPGSDLLERIVYVRDEIIELGVALAPQQLILAQLATGICRHIRPFIRPYFRDSESRLRNLIDEQNSYKEMLANSLELYRSAMSSRTNDTMKVLTAMSALFLPLTFLTGLFGMNVFLPMSHTHYAFIWILVICMGSFVGMMAYFKAKNWF
jgi:magnesium transporter